MLATIPSSRYVLHGSLSVPRTADRMYEQAERYLCSDSTERNLFNRLEHSSRNFRLAINHRNDDSFDAGTNTIAWDPYSALRTTTGGRQSPALGLAHEIDHAVESPARNTRLSRLHVRGYDNAEERRVIEHSETRAARSLGEDIRHDHRGTTYRVASPISR